MRSLRGVRVVIVMRPARGGLGRFVTGSLTVHGLLLAAVLVVPASRHKVAPIDDAMVVALAGPITAAPPRGGSAAALPAKPAAPAETHPAPKEAHTVREVPVAKPKDKPPKPKDKPAPPLAKAPETAPRPESPPGPTPGSADDQKAGRGAAEGAVTATLAGGDSSLGWYGAAVKAALEAVWMKPYLEDEQGAASVVVAFDIARDGTTRNLRIVQSSGIPSLDRSAERAVIEASPLPAVPPSWTGETIPVTMRFELGPEAR